MSITPSNLGLPQRILTVFERAGLELHNYHPENQQLEVALFVVKLADNPMRRRALLMRYRNFGKKSYAQLNRWLGDHGFDWVLPPATPSERKLSGITFPRCECCGQTLPPSQREERDE